MSAPNVDSLTAMAELLAYEINAFCVGEDEPATAILVLDALACAGLTLRWDDGGEASAAFFAPLLDAASEDHT